MYTVFYLQTLMLLLATLLVISSSSLGFDTLVISQRGRRRNNWLIRLIGSIVWRIYELLSARVYTGKPCNNALVQDRVPLLIEKIAVF